MKHQYIVEIRGNDTWEATKTVADNSFAEAYLSAVQLKDSWQKTTVEKLRITEIIEVEHPTNYHLRK